MRRGIDTTIELLPTSKAHCRGYGIDPIEISAMEFSKIAMALDYLGKN